MPQLNPIYPEGQLHSKPSEFLFGVQVPLLRQGLAEHTLSVEKSITFETVMLRYEVFYRASYF